eukprot:421879_1
MPDYDVSDSAIHKFTVGLRAELSLHCVTLLCFSISLVCLIYHFYYVPGGKASRITPFIRYSILAHSSLYFVSYITSIILDINEYKQVIYYHNYSYFHSTQFTYIYGFNNIIWSLARCSFFTLWIGRHYYSFQGSIYQSPFIVHVLLALGVVSMFVLLMFVNIAVLALEYIHLQSSLVLSSVVAFGVIEFIIAVSIIYLFVHKLFQLILNTTKYDEILDSHRYTKQSRANASSKMESESDATYTVPLRSAPLSKSKQMSQSRMSLFIRWQSFVSGSSQSDQFSFKLAPSQLVLINTITQNALIGCITIISAQIYVVLFMLHAFEIGLQSHYIAGLLVSCYRPIDSIIQCFCIYISFNFSHDIYKKCCQKIHNGLRTFCQKIARRRIKTRLIQKDITVDCDYQLI